MLTKRGSLLQPCYTKLYTISKKHSCLGVFLDIEGAFDNVGFDAIIEAARYHGIPSIITNWIYQMLKNRNLFSTLRQAEISKLSVRGCPQGGVLSPLLWNLVADTLLRELNNSGFPTLTLIHISEPTRLGMISYAVFCLKKK